MKRYTKTLYTFWSASISAEMEYRANFALAALTSLASLGGALFALWALLRTEYVMNGWSFNQALIVVGIYTMLDGLQQTLLAPNRVQISEFVREGTLDFVLLKPIDSQFWLSVRKLSIWGIPNIFLGLGLLIYAASFRLEPAVEVINYAYLLIPLAAGITIYYALGYLLSTLTIWFTKLANITHAMHALLEAGRYPISAYPGTYRAFFTFVLPVAFMTTVPAEVLLGRGEVTWVLGGLAIAGALLIAARLFWHFALRFYTSASS
ncbi:MAG: ABC-2 family transporter protein [Planctomycetota bacterium]